MYIYIAIFFMCVGTEFYLYGPPPLIYVILLHLHMFLTEAAIKYNQILYPDYWELSSDSSDENNRIEYVIDNLKREETKYEDKYLSEIRLLNKEWEFTDEEKNKITELTQELFQKYVGDITNEINSVLIQINHLKQELEEDKDDTVQIEEYPDGYIIEISLEERQQRRETDIIDLNNKLKELKEKNNPDNLLILSEKEAYDQIIKSRLEKLNNCYIMEYTPQGNVLMIYDANKETFKFYADKNIPYRYLEVAGRKYVKSFNCRPIFIDMEEELRLFEERWNKHYEMKKQREIEEQMKEKENNQLNITKQADTKKNVFAKLKSYNKVAGGKISTAMAAPPKNSIPNRANVITNEKENEKIILKEKANRYTYEGKFANFPFLQKVEKKVFNKKLGLSFADFKKMNVK